MHTKEPEGFKKLITYNKSDQLMEVCFSVTKEFKYLRDKTLEALADQMARSARSVKQNVVEGWKRNTTEEYLSFLGFALASLAELMEDVDDIIKGRYEGLRGVKGIMGERGIEISIENVERLPFYPLPPFLPLIIQLKLRCKELSYLIYRLQQSLDKKMIAEGTLSIRKKLKNRNQEIAEADNWLKDYIKNNKPPP